jgi:hypothetical protein
VQIVFGYWANVSGREQFIPIDGGALQVSKAVLTKYSRYFETMFSSGMMEATSHVVKFSGRHVRRRNFARLYQIMLCGGFVVSTRTGQE